MRIGDELDVAGGSLVERGAHVGGWSLGDRLSRKGDLCHGRGSSCRVALAAMCRKRDGQCWRHKAIWSRGDGRVQDGW